MIFIPYTTSWQTIRMAMDDLIKQAEQEKKMQLAHKAEQIKCGYK